MFGFFSKKPKTRKKLLKEKAIRPNGKTSILTGLIVGGAIGSVMSLLFAPQSGKKTRKKVADTSKDMYKKGKTQAELFIEKYNKKVKKQLGEKTENKKSEE